MRPSDEYLREYRRVRNIEQNYPRAAAAGLLKRLHKDLEQRWKNLGAQDQAEALRQEPRARP